MSTDTLQFTIDGEELSAQRGQTILEAADEAGVYIPRLCFMKGLSPFGSCRLCTVLVNGRPQSACTHPVTPGVVVENDTPELRDQRRSLLEMLFIEGNHFCMYCEKSGHCELQALGYRFGVMAARHDDMSQTREVDASHAAVMIDRNRCVLCARCVRASRELDGKNVFHFVGRGADKRVAVNAAEGLVGTDIDPNDAALNACPVGAILRKRVGFAVPIGERRYDHRPIGSDIEERSAVASEGGRK